jgi:hypothetical protein
MVKYQKKRLFWIPGSKCLGCFFLSSVLIVLLQSELSVAHCFFAASKSFGAFIFWFVLAPSPKKRDARAKVVRLYS